MGRYRWIVAHAFPCPHCGATVAAGRRFCRECGSDAETGWSEDAETDSIELPESMSDEDYEEFLAREFPGAEQARRIRWKRIAWKLALAVLAAALLIWTLR